MSLKSRYFLVVAVVGALTAAGSASAGPTPTTVSLTLQPNQNIELRLDHVPRGMFVVDFSLGSDEAQHFTLTKRRVRTKYRVIASPKGVGTARCGVAAGTQHCRGLRTKADASGAYVFRLTNLGTRPLTTTLRIAWRATR